MVRRNSNNRPIGSRVHSVSGSTLDIAVTVAEYTAATPVTNAAYVQGFVVVRTANVPQKFEVSAGTSTLNVIAAELQTQSDEVTFSVFDNTNIKVVDNTLNTEGKITVVTADSFGSLLGFVGGTASVSQDSLTAFYETQASASELPLFFHSTISADSYANPPDTFLTSFTSSQSLSAFDPNNLITFLNPYGIAPAASGTLTLVSGAGDATITFTGYAVSAIPYQYLFTVTSASAVANAIYSNNNQFFKVTSTIIGGTTLTTIGAGLVDDEQPSNESVQVSADAANVVTILPEYPNVRRLRINDRFFVANPLDFGYNDTVVAIVDNNTVGETYTLPLYRRAIVNSTYAPNNYSFNAYDVDSGTTANFATNFFEPTDFFANYKALMQAKYVLQSSNAQTALLYRSILWGRSGESINVSYVYPTAPNLPIDSTVTVDDSTNIKISLASGNPIATQITSNTQWNVTVTSNNPAAGTDQVTYTYNGTGTAPNLTLSGGEYVTILPSTGFNTKNTGTFRVSTATGFTPTSTSFSVPVRTGTALAQSNVVTTVPSGMYFYSATPTTAAQINTYVNANLPQYVTTTIVNDGGMTGSGVIALSTYENSGFTNSSYSLKDGINWISTSNVSGSPQFTLKTPLTYPSDTGYSFFTSGDEVRLVPTTMDQVKDLWNILAVTGFTTVGTIEVVDRGSKLQLATNTLGSSGSIQIVGGSGNEYVVPVLTSGNLIDNSHMIISANSIASQAVASDQWFRLQAESAQNKDTGISNNTSVTVLSNTPIAGQSKVTLLNQESGQLYFGSPKNFTRIQGSTFRIEKQGSLACLSWNGIGSAPDFSVAANINDSAPWTVNVTSAGVYTVATGNVNFAALTIGDLITISGLNNAGNNGTFFIQGISPNGLSFTVDNPNASNETGTAVTPGEFSSTSSISEGDTVILSSPFSPLNQGTYRVIRMFNNSIWYENSNVIEEEIVCIPNTISTSYDGTTVFNVTANGGTETISWTGAGTAPALGRILTGDVVTFGTGFSSPNQGSFMVVSSGPAQQQVVQLTFPAGSTFSSSGTANYFEIYNGGNTNKYYIWYNVSGGSNTDPAPAGFTGIEVAINNSDSAATVAAETYTAINAMLAAMTSTYVATTNVVTVSANVAAQTNSPVNVSMPAAFSFIITQTGQEPFFSVINPSAVAQSGISAVTFVVNRPQIQFFQYEATVPGDLLSVNGTVLGAGNAGNYKILQVLNQDTVIVQGTITTQFNNNLAGNSISLNVVEGIPYTGYKQVDFVAMDPGSTTFTNIIFNTSAQFEKIDLSADVGMTSLSKLNFPTTIRTGIDSYNYDTGLIGQANRTIYGDPRDAVTYPGVNAAGTDIFIREPLLRRIQIALAIRTNIGVSFPQIVSQIQSSVYALIQANPLGQSIDLSSIVETVRLIPGITSVVLTSPTYTVSSDEIQLVTGEKAFIVNQATDISVSLIGS